MTRYFRRDLLCVVSLCAFACPSGALATDLESFEFSDGAGTLLAAAANTANPNNNWFEGTSMGASDVRNGSYNIVKQSTSLVSNYLQINDISTGTRYLVATMSGWDFYQNPGDPSEEFRLAFLNDDTGNSGSTIAAQMNIRREAGGSNIVLVGSALGTGSADIAGAPVLNNTQTNPFTMVLELNKTSNSYKVFYKDGTNPTQVLGLGAIAPTRNGNSIRMAVNNDFQTFGDYPDPQSTFEVFSVDRIALTDTNPFSDLITLEVDRGNASLTLRNTSGSTISGIQSYSITSAAGALNPAGWSPGAATPTTSTNSELAATFSTPINLANSATLPLSTAAGAWLKSPSEDLQMVLNLSGGGSRTVNVNFLANGGVKYQSGDFDFDNDIDGNDWLTFIANSETDIASLTQVQRYRLGDLDGDGMNSIADFVAFKTLYDAAHGGAGAFEAMIAGLATPEPGSLMLLGSAALLVVVSSRRRYGTPQRSCHSSISTNALDRQPKENAIMPRIHQLVLLMVALGVATGSRHAHAAILEDFQFSDSNGTTLDAAVNSINAANTWQLGGNSWDPSAVTGGSFQITKTSTNLSTAHIDMANVSIGKVWLVAEMAGWNFSATASSPSEEVRLTFLDNDNSPASGSTITAQMLINRSGAGLSLVGTGALGTGATNITGSYALPLVQTNPFTMVLELDKDADQYSVYYKDGNAPFASIGAPGLLGASTLHSGDRDGNSIRFAATGSFSDAGEFVDVSRIYLTDMSPIIGTVDPTTLTLEVKSNGQVSLRNDTDNPISFNSYRIGFTDSLTDDLNFAGWNSLSDKNLNPVLGGDDPGETWDEAGGSSDKVLAESFLLGSSTITPANSISLGGAFKVGGAHEQLTFEYFDINTGAITPGEIDFITVVGVTGDYNNNGTVDAADYVLFRNLVGTNTPLPNDAIGGTIGIGQYDQWRSHFGQTAGSGTGTLESAAVPEPATLVLLVSLLVTSLTKTRPRH